MRYQFRIDGRAVGEIRERWEDAAQELVSAGCGIWVKSSGALGPSHKTAIKIDPSSGAEIARLSIAP